ncbi:hypothetical protein RI054_22g95950 [Pseudoscourfieldia marina]
MVVAAPESRSRSHARSPSSPAESSLRSLLSSIEIRDGSIGGTQIHKYGGASGEQDLAGGLHPHGSLKNNSSSKAGAPQRSSRKTHAAHGDNVGGGGAHSTPTAHMNQKYTAARSAAGLAENNNRESDSVQALRNRLALGALCVFALWCVPTSAVVTALCLIILAWALGDQMHTQLGFRIPLPFVTGGTMSRSAVQRIKNEAYDDGRKAGSAEGRRAAEGDFSAALANAKEQVQREFDAAVADAAAQARAEGDAKIEELRKELESTEAARDKALEQEEVAKKHIKIYNPKRIDIRQWKREQEALEERMRELEGAAGEARAKLEDARQTERRVRSEVEREFWKNLEQAKEQVRREYEADVARAKAEVEASLSSRLASAKEDGRRQADEEFAGALEAARVEVRDEYNAALSKATESVRYEVGREMSEELSASQARIAQLHAEMAAKVLQHRAEVRREMLAKITSAVNVARGEEATRFSRQIDQLKAEHSEELTRALEAGIAKVWSLAEEEQRKALKALKEQHDSEMRRVEARYAEEIEAEAALRAAKNSPYGEDVSGGSSAVSRLKTAHAQDIVSARAESRRKVEELRDEHLAQVQRLVAEHEEEIERERSAAADARASLVTAQSNTSRSRGEISELKSRVAGLESQLSTMALEKEEMATQMKESLSKAVEDSLKDAEGREGGKKTRLESIIESVEAERSRLESELDEREAEVDRLEAELADVRAQLSAQLSSGSPGLARAGSTAVEEAGSTLAKQLSRGMSGAGDTPRLAAEKAAVEAQLAETKEKLAAAESKSSTLSDELARKAAASPSKIKRMEDMMNERLEDERTRAQTKLRAAEEKLALVEAELKDARDALKAKGEELEKLQLRVASAGAQDAATAATVSNLEERLSELTREAESARAAADRAKTLEVQLDERAKALEEREDSIAQLKSTLEQTRASLAIRDDELAEQVQERKRITEDSVTSQKELADLRMKLEREKSSESKLLDDARDKVEALEAETRQLREKAAKQSLAAPSSSYDNTKLEELIANTARLGGTRPAGEDNALEVSATLRWSERRDSEAKKRARRRWRQAWWYAMSAPGAKIAHSPPMMLRQFDVDVDIRPSQSFSNARLEEKEAEVQRITAEAARAISARDEQMAVAEREMKRATELLQSGASELEGLESSVVGRSGDYEVLASIARGDIPFGIGVEGGDAEEVDRLRVALSDEKAQRASAETSLRFARATHVRLQQLETKLSGERAARGAAEETLARAQAAGGSAAGGVVGETEILELRKQAASNEREKETYRAQVGALESELVSLRNKVETYKSAARAAAQSPSNPSVEAPAPRERGSSSFITSHFTSASKPGEPSASADSTAKEEKGKERKERKERSSHREKSRDRSHSRSRSKTPERATPVWTPVQPTPVAADTLPSSMPPSPQEESAERFRKALKKGASFIKHTQNKKPATRVLWVSDALDKICWGTNRSRSAKDVMVAQIASVETGRLDGIASKHRTGVNATDVLSLVGKEGVDDVDLQVPSAGNGLSRDDWAAAFTWLLSTVPAGTVTPPLASRVDAPSEATTSPGVSPPPNPGRRA